MNLGLCEDGHQNRRHLKGNFQCFDVTNAVGMAASLSEETGHGSGRTARVVQDFIKISEDKTQNFSSQQGSLRHVQKPIPGLPWTRPT